jgi:hypothetical protein
VSLSRVSFSCYQKELRVSAGVAYLIACIEKTVLSEKMIDNDLSRVGRVQSNPRINWVLVLRGMRIRVRRVLPSSFLPLPTIKRRKQSNPLKPITHPIQSLSSTIKEK